MISTKDFTIIIPAISYKDVKKCIKKIRQKYKKIKIVVCLNELNLKKNIDKNLKFIITNKKPIGKKRNLAANISKTKYLAFIDSDAYPGKNWIESTYKYLKIKKLGIIAGPHVDPIKQNDSEKFIGLVKKSFFITMRPNLQKSYKEKLQFVKFAPSVNWIMSKKFFYSMKQMDDYMLRNEDWDFVHRMKKKKFKLLYSPKTLVYHENGSISHFLKKRFYYGLHMWPILLKLNFENYYLFTPLFVVILLLSFPISLFLDHYFFIYIFILISYVFFMIVETLRICNRLYNFPKILMLLVFASISPGLGTLMGIFKFSKK